MMSIGVLRSICLLPLSRMRFRFCYLVSCLVLSSFLFDGTYACWGKTAPNYGDMTRDYDIEVGSELVLNCTLRNKTFKDLSRPVDSSDLVIETADQEFSNITRRINDSTIQLRIPKASENDTGVYYCKIFLPNEKPFEKPVVCISKVSVGYKPQHVTNFTCISRNFENLNCSWNIEENKVLTKYTIVKYRYGVPGFDQRCPNSTERPNSCEWSTKTDPVYQPSYRNISFTIRGSNSLGKIEDNFTIDGYTIVVPNNPENLNATFVGNTSVTIEWTPPNMRNFVYKLPLKYEIWISKILYNSSDIKIYDAGSNTLFTINNLIPYISYNISVRCRSAYTDKEDMWSTFASLVVKTLPDVPYKVPKVIPEAYELHFYEGSRSAFLYWKAIPEMHHNGEKFHYHIKYSQNILSTTSRIDTVNSSIPFVNIKNLLKNSTYFFHIHSANEVGISKEYEVIYIASEDKIPPPPRDVRVISQDLGHYNLSWNPPNELDNFSYIVFWCSSLKPWMARCDNPIQWFDEKLSENNIVLNLTDIKTNFQFAVVSKSDSGSSGMQWASCIVPNKGGISKIKYVVVEQKSSTTLKVIWNLDCSAEKAVVDRYEIIYCAMQRNKECNVVEVEPNADNFLLKHLHPFSNYSVKIRAINHDNKASEDSDAVFQTTSPGAPSGPPRNIQVFSESKEAFFVSWTPPAEPNGIITKYIISYNGFKNVLDVEPNKSEYVIEIKGLKPYSVYAVQVQACVRNDCSIKSEPAMVQTEVDVPGYMEPPRIEEVNSTHFKVSWTTPISPNGPIDFYVIKWHAEKHNATSDMDNILEVNGTNSVVLDVKCPSLGEEAVKYLFYVRAVNVKNGTKLFGPFSNSTQAKACLMPEGVGMFIGIIVGAAFGAAFLFVVIYKFAIWMKFKIHQVKSITIRLPEGLEGPETNPLNNYECFKNGLNGNLQTNNNERLSYIIDENKNRHGSGSSQFSNSSAEELIFKNGKCTKFGRKPSGDSSGCSSMSSSITPRIHLSSDSGTESDFAIPPSPDSAMNEPSLHNSHKTPLPILMEVHDQAIGDKASLQSTLSPDKQPHKHKNATDDMILKVDPPYSKFGFAGNTNSSLPWRVNPLAFYSCNLANSEPSVFDPQNPEKAETVLAPYSKIGLAKSSGDIGMSAVKEIGYSKFGFPSSQKRFSIPPPNVNPIAMVMFENPDRKEWPNIKKLLGNNNNDYTHSKIGKEANVNIPSNDLVEDCGYIKVGRGNLCPVKPTQAYVPFNDLRSQMDQNLSNTLVNNTAEQIKNVYDGSPTDKDQVEYPDDVEWPAFNPCDEESGIDCTPEVSFNVPFLSSCTIGTPLEEGLYNSNNNYSFEVPCCPNSDESLPKVCFESDIKYNSDSPTLSFSEVSFENSPFIQNQVSSIPNGDSTLYPKDNSTLVESQHDETPSNKTESYAIPNEVIVTPMTLRNSYVPFNSLSDSVCDRTLNHLPNVPRTVLPSGICTEADNYITPTHKGEISRLLRDNSLPKTISVVSPTQRDTLNDTEKYIANGNGYANLSLKYILKPLPKMESEICEV